MFLTSNGLKQLALYLDRLFDGTIDWKTRKRKSQKVFATETGFPASTLSRLRKNRDNDGEAIAAVVDAQTLLRLAEYIPDPRTGRPFTDPRDLVRMVAEEIPFEGERRVEGALAAHLKEEMIRLNLNKTALSNLLGIEESRLEAILRGETPSLAEILEMGRQLREDRDATPFFVLAGCNINAPLVASA